MKKVCTFVLVSCIVFFQLMDCLALKNAVEVKVFHSSGGNGAPMVPDENYLKGHYTFQTVNGDEIKYIIHYLSLLSREEKRNDFGTVNDGQYSTVEFLNGKCNNKIIIHSDSFVVDSKGNEYLLDKENFARFTEFVYALKIGGYILLGEVDFEPSAWAKTFVEDAITKQLVPEWNQINYQGKIPRVEVCQLIDNYLKLEGYSCDYEDITFYDTSDQSVIMLNELGIVDGRGDGKFYPYDYITREEFAKILFKTYETLYGKTELMGVMNYKDSDSIADWARESVSLMTDLGLFNGNENNEFMPKENITKEQVISILVRLSQLRCKCNKTE